jgi:transposase
VTIVMRLDRHRAQSTAEWIDTSTGEVSRQRVAPADRAGMRRFAERFRGRELEVALEVTTGWRFVVEEFQTIGARVHLAEPAETAARRGTKKRAKGDRADARHLRELLMVGRLPESWIPPEHLIDLRARVRLRHTLVDQRREWQQRMQAVLYHHGVPPCGWLLGDESRAWLTSLALPTTAREQLTVALAMIDALDAQLAPLDRELRNYARRQAGCRALMRHFGIGPLDRNDDPRRARRRPPLLLLARAVRYSGLDITVHKSDALLRARPPCQAKGHRRCAGRSSTPPSVHVVPVRRTTRITSRPPAARRQPRVPGHRAQAAQAQLPILRELGERALQPA